MTLEHDRVGLAKEQATALIRQAHMHLFPDGTYRTNPPERGVVTNIQDLQRHRITLADFKHSWEDLTLKQQAYVLRKAHSRDRREWTVDMSNDFGHAVIKCSGVAELTCRAVGREDTTIRVDCWPLLPVTIYFWTREDATRFVDATPRLVDAVITETDRAEPVRWSIDTGLMFADLADAMQYAVATSAHYPPR